FAAAAFADDPDDFARLDGKRDVLERFTPGFAVIERHAKVADIEQRSIVCAFRPDKTHYIPPVWPTLATDFIKSHWPREPAVCGVGWRQVSAWCSAGAHPTRPTSSHCQRASLPNPYWTVLNRALILARSDP